MARATEAAAGPIEVVSAQDVLHATGISARHNPSYTYYPRSKDTYRNGSFQATMSDGCVVRFRSTGVMSSSTSSCTLTQKSNATVAVIEYKRDHNLD